MNPFLSRDLIALMVVFLGMLKRRSISYRSVGKILHIILLSCADSLSLSIIAKIILAVKSMDFSADNSFDNEIRMLRPISSSTMYCAVNSVSST